MTRTASFDVAPTIVAAGRRVVARSGAQSLTLRDVAAEAEVSPQSLYNRFGTRQALLDDVATDGLRRLIEAIMGADERPLASVGDPLLAIVEVLRRHRRFALAEPRLERFLFDDDVDGFEPSTRTRSRREECLGILAAVTGRAMAAGLLLPGDRDDIAGRLWAVARGALDLGFDDRRFEAAVATMIRGLRPSAQLR
jgi:AcrR family transcriptional regulator